MIVVNGASSKKIWLEGARKYKPNIGVPTSVAGTPRKLSPLRASTAYRKGRA